MHDIPYVKGFIILQNNVMDAINSILLGRPSLWDAKVSHEYDNNLVTIQGNGIIK